MSKWRTIVVDDVGPLRELIRLLLQADGRFDVVAVASDGLEAVEQTREYQPELIILDISMPVMTGLQAIPLLRRVAPNACVALLTGYEDELIDVNVADGAPVFSKLSDEKELADALADAAERSNRGRS